MLLYLTFYTTSTDEDFFRPAFEDPIDTQPASEMPIDKIEPHLQPRDNNWMTNNISSNNRFNINNTNNKGPHSSNPQ